jgi:hypothetical protein
MIDPFDSRHSDETTLHDAMRRFTERWQRRIPHEDRAAFEADFLMVVQAVHRDAMRPVSQLLRSAMAALPISPLLIPTPAEKPKET